VPTRGDTTHPCPFEQCLSPDKPIQDQPTHEELAKETLYEIQVEQRLTRIEQLIETAMLLLMEKRSQKGTRACRQRRYRFIRYRSMPR
jgi:hypothetical protein